MHCRVSIGLRRYLHAKLDGFMNTNVICHNSVEFSEMQNSARPSLSFDLDKERKLKVGLYQLHLPLI